MVGITIGVVGNPNCGKTTLFNALTGAKQTVGNWPGVTVDRKTGNYSHDSKPVDVVDTPGIYSMAATSVDEKVTRDYVLSRDADLIVNIVDASNIERNLYLTSQLLEMQVPMIVVLNMMDVARERRLEIDIKELEHLLGCPVIPIVAAKNKGVETLKKTINTAAAAKNISPAEIVYPPGIIKAREQVEQLLPETLSTSIVNRQWFATKLLESDEQAYEDVGTGIREGVIDIQEQIEEDFDEEADIMIASARYGFITDIAAKAVKKKGRVGDSLSAKIDRIVLHRVFGIPVFFAAMYLMFMFTINLGGAFIDFFDILFGAICVDGYGAVLESMGFSEWSVTILAGGFGGGLQTMATFIPPIGFMFLFLSFLEDSGYMARAAFVMDRAMRIIGLPGKAFIPMLVAFGCNVPAIMATRTMENERDRTLSILMNPFMSCGARLPVYALFAAAFFPVGGQNLVFLLYIIGIGFAVLTGLVLKKTLLKGEITSFVMELPPYHMPTLKSLLLRTWDRLTSFLFRAGRVLIPVIIVLSFMNSMGTDGSFGNDDSEDSLLAAVGKAITPAFVPMGLTEENWPATVGIFTGIFAKEAVVGTLDALYTHVDTGGPEESAEPVTMATVFAGVMEAFATIPANLADVAGTALDPLGLSVGDVSSFDSAAGELEVSTGTFGSMVKLFADKTAAFAYLLFILLYFPCVAAIAAVYRELNLGWTLFVGAWTTGLAYMTATIFYQAGTMALHPVSSIKYIVSLLSIFALVVLGMWIIGNRKKTTVPLVGKEITI